MGFWNHDSDEAQAYEEVTTAPHKAELSHELIAAAASYEAAKAYEKHCQANGKPDSHAKAKELMAGLAGAFIDRMVETKGTSLKAKRRLPKWGVASKLTTTVSPIIVILLTPPQLDYVDKKKAQHQASQIHDEQFSEEVYVEQEY